MQPTTVEPDRPAHGSPATFAITGHCLCGAVTITVAGEQDPRVGACHCRMCQRWSGGLFLCFTADASVVTVTGEVAHYRSSAFAERAFCPRCGSHLWFNDVEDGGEPRSYELMPGLFDAARGWPLRSEIYLAVDGFGGEALLDSYESERLPVAREVLRLSNALFEVAAGQTGWRASLRDVLAPLVVAPASKIDIVQKIAFRKFSQIDIAYAPSIVVECGSQGGVNQARPGQRAPDAQLSRHRTLFRSASHSYVPLRHR